MLSSVNSVNMQPVQKNADQPSVHPHALIDDRSIKGILFLGVKGDISSVIDTESKIDLLV